MNVNAKEEIESEWTEKEIMKENLLRDCELEIDKTLVYSAIENTPKTKIIQGP